MGIWDVSLYMVAPDQPRGFRGLVWDLQEWLWRATRVSALQEKAFDAMAMVALCSGAASSYLLLALALLQQGRSDASAQCGISDGATLLAVPVPFGMPSVLTLRCLVLLGVAWCCLVLLGVGTAERLTALLAAVECTEDRPTLATAVGSAVLLGMRSSVAGRSSSAMMSHLLSAGTPFEPSTLESPVCLEVSPDTMFGLSKLLEFYLPDLLGDNPVRGGVVACRSRTCVPLIGGCLLGVHRPMRPSTMWTTCWAFYAATCTNCPAPTLTHARWDSVQARSSSTTPTARTTGPRSSPWTAS